ncbi:MAG TPA: ABC transporter ATP-binding protein [Levilinea sp.]|nr:ABC transporter ATP-binding protein [Levilinea sp.]
MSSHNSPRPSSDERPRLGMAGRGPLHVQRIEKAHEPRRALKRLLPYLRPYTAELALVFLFVAIYTGLGLVGPYLLGVAIDEHIMARRLAGLGSLALWMLAVYLLFNGFQAAANWIMARVSQRALKLVRRDLFAHMQMLSIGFFDRHTAGELMSRLTNDIDAINQAVSQNVTALVASVLSLLGIVTAMFLLNPWLALATLIIVPVIYFFTNFIATYTRKGFRRLQQQLGGLNSVVEETISGQKVIKAFRRSDPVTQLFRQHNQAVYEAGVYAHTYAMMLMPLSAVLGNFFVIILASFGGYLALQGLVTVGTIATFIFYGKNFIGPLQQLANMFNTIQAALAGVERIFEVIDEPAETLDLHEAIAQARITGDVRFEHVCFGYQPGHPVIKDMSLEVKAGQTIALVGPTGAGKTTIINLLTRFYEIDSGRITIDGVDIRQMNKGGLRRNLGIVLQDTFLFADTVMENIRYGRLDASDEEVMRAGELAEADHFIRQLPQGYHTLLAERAGNLSQGQRQLLAIARAILAEPSILILDEATSSVDTRTEARIQKALLRLMEARTSFVIAHRLSTIRDADCVLVIRDGEIVEQGSHQALLDRRGFYHHLYISQFKGQAI